MEWTDNEEGPMCICNTPTRVKRTGDPDHPWALLCLFHTKEAGMFFELPPEKPEGWPNNVQALIDIGIRARNHVPDAELDPDSFCFCHQCCLKRELEEEKEQEGT